MNPENREKLTKRQKKTYYRVRVTRKPPAYKNWRKKQKTDNKRAVSQENLQQKTYYWVGSAENHQTPEKMKMKPENREQAEKAETVLVHQKITFT